MIAAKDIMLAMFDSTSVADEHADEFGAGGTAAIRSAGLPDEILEIAKINAAGYPEQVVNLVGQGMTQEKAILTVLAASFIEGAIATARACRMDGDDD